MAATVQDLLSQHSTNHVQTTGYHTTTDKQWTRQYPSIESVTIYSFSLPEDPQTVNLKRPKITGGTYQLELTQFWAMRMELRK
ncbi:hypothetical protein V8F33_013943 [Rhypophila sp. PSN 637]